MVTYNDYEAHINARANNLDLDRMDLHLAISLDDEEILFGGELAVELGVPGVDTERRGVTQLVGGSHDDEVRHPDASDDRGGDLLVPATDEKALRAHRAQHEFRGRMCVEELQKSLLVQIHRQELLSLHSVDPEQRAADLEFPFDVVDGPAGPKQVQRPRVLLHFLDHMLGDR